MLGLFRFFVCSLVFLFFPGLLARMFTKEGCNVASHNFLTSGEGKFTTQTQTGDVLIFVLEHLTPFLIVLMIVQDMSQKLFCHTPRLYGTLRDLQQTCQHLSTNLVKFRNISFLSSLQIKYFCVFVLTTNILPSLTPECAHQSIVSHT